MIAKVLKEVAALPLLQVAKPTVEPYRVHFPSAAST
jgi:hypothetical protein